MVSLLALMLIVSCSSKKNGESNYSVTLSLSGFEDSTMFKLLHLDSLEFIDSAYIVNGKVQFKGTVKEPFTARIHTVDDKYVILWIEDKEISINGNYQDFFYSKFEGSALNAVMAKYRDKQAQLQIQRNSLMKRMIALMSEQTANAEEEFDKLNSQVIQIDKEVIDIRVDGIVSEQPSYFTVQELYFLRNDLSNDSLKLLFNKFPEFLQATKYGDVIRTYLDNKAPAVGEHYVDIEGVNENGQIVKLSQFSGKYVLLDFWASWCGPCRQENPNLVQAYKKYRDKGFEILSFSTDNNVNSWRNAIEEDSLTWTNIIDLHGSYSKMAALYGVRAIPASFLINPDGIIIARNLRGKMLEEKLNEEFKNYGL